SPRRAECYAHEDADKARHNGQPGYESKNLFCPVVSVVSAPCPRLHERITLLGRAQPHDPRVVTFVAPYPHVSRKFLKNLFLLVRSRPVCPFCPPFALWPFSSVLSPPYKCPSPKHNSNTFANGYSRSESAWRAISRAITQRPSRRCVMNQASCPRRRCTWPIWEPTRKIRSWMRPTRRDNRSNSRRSMRRWSGCIIGRKNTARARRRVSRFLTSGWT